MNDNEEKVILVDENDNQIGIEYKLQAHKNNKLHRALSIFIFNSKGQVLLQQRLKEKYHSGGLWTNTCCSHPREGEETLEAAHRRLKEEMGFDTDLKEIFSFTYKVDFENELHEHEFDHVFIGKYDENPTPNKEEVEDWSWINLKDLKEDVKKNPDKYTYWLRISMSKLSEYLEKENL